MNIKSNDAWLAARAVQIELGIPENSVCLVGSSLIVGEGSDIDVLCLMDSTLTAEGIGFEYETDVVYDGNRFVSMRRGSLNLLITDDPLYFASEIAIAYSAKISAEGNFDMTQREDRVEFHQGVRDWVSEYISQTPVMESANG